MRSSPESDEFVRQEVAIGIDHAELIGDLALPPRAEGLVVFAHGSGSSRFSKRNRWVASVLNNAGLGTLLIDLLTLEEEREDLVTRRLRFNIPLLAERVIGAIDWLSHEPRASELSYGCFGASTGGAAALIAAAARPKLVHAVVSRGGRPDLVPTDVLTEVRAPTLLIIGGEDQDVIEMNRQAAGHMTCEKGFEIIPGATHLFEERGKLDEVARLATQWFVQHLSRSPSAAVETTSRRADI